MAGLGQVRPRGERRERTVLRQFAVHFVLALALLVGRNTAAVQAAAQVITTALVPVERALAQTGTALSSFAEAVSEIHTLRADNARLRDDVDRLTLENVRLREQAIAAQQAAKLGAVARQTQYETVSAQVIARDPSGIHQTVMLGSGSNDGIKVGHVVMSDQGVVGRVSEVGPDYSKVLLVTDPASAISAIVQDSRATGIVRGQYGDTLIMEWILQTEKVAVDDVVLTAGLALGNDLRSLYPKGLVVGRVLQLQQAEAAAYQRAIIAPAVDLRRLENVLVVRTTP